MTDLAKLNRLRVNANKPELKSWKASKAKLTEAITTLEGEGFTDALPGANLGAAPVTTDPEVIAALTPKPKDDDEEHVIPSLADSALSKSVSAEPKPEVKKQKERASLARGLDTDAYAKHSRDRVRDIREKERKDKKKEPAARLNLDDRKQIKDEAEDRRVKPTGAVDPKREPEKAKRQLKHIEEKQAARAAKKDKPVKDANEITVADIARELEIDPKVARAKLRRHEAKLEKLHTKGQDRWTFPMSAKDEIVKILK